MPFLIGGAIGVPLSGVARWRARACASSSILVLFSLTA
jgi:hypothetical protein